MRVAPGVSQGAGHNRAVLRAKFALVLLPWLAGCRSDRPEPVVVAPPLGDIMQEHETPEALQVLAARSRIASAADGASQFLLELDVPTGGHEFGVADGGSVLGEDGVLTVLCDLTGPGNQEIVTQAVETLSVSIPVPGAAKRCVVSVRRWVRGWSYIVAPEFFVVAEHDVPR
jgi:hypothetical protein